jgi:hypothetical protein
VAGREVSALQGVTAEAMGKSLNLPESFATPMDYAIVGWCILKPVLRNPR